MLLPLLARATVPKRKSLDYPSGRSYDLPDREITQDDVDQITAYENQLVARDKARPQGVPQHGRDQITPDNPYAYDGSKEAMQQRVAQDAYAAHNAQLYKLQPLTKDTRPGVPMQIGGGFTGSGTALPVRGTVPQTKSQNQAAMAKSKAAQSESLDNIRRNTATAAQALEDQGRETVGNIGGFVGNLIDRTAPVTGLTGFEQGLRKIGEHTGSVVAYYPGVTGIEAAGHVAAAVDPGTTIPEKGKELALAAVEAAPDKILHGVGKVVAAGIKKVAPDLLPGLSSKVGQVLEKLGFGSLNTPEEVTPKHLDDLKGVIETDKTLSHADQNTLQAFHDHLSNPEPVPETNPVVPKVEPTPKVEATARVAPKVPFTGTKNAITEVEHAELGRDPIVKQAFQDGPASVDAGKAAINEKKIDPRALADDVNTNPRVLSATERGALLVDRVSIKNELRTARTALKANPADLGLQDAVRTAEDALVTNTGAAQKSGREWAASGHAMQVNLGEDYSIEENIDRARAVRDGGEIPSATRKKLEDLSAKHQQVTADLDAANARIADLEAQKGFNRTKLAARSAARQMTRQELDAELSSMLDDFKKGGGVGKARNRGAIDVEPAILVAKVVKNRIQAGAVTLQEAVDQTLTALKEHIPGLTERDVRDAFSNYGKETQGKPLTETQRRTQVMKGIAANTSKLEDVEAGTYKPTIRVKSQASKEVENLLYERDKLRNQINQTIAAQKPKTLGQKLIDTANIPRTLMATGDMSATLRQALWLNVSHPVTGAKAMTAATKSFFSEKFAYAMDRAIKADPLFRAAEKANLHMSALPGAPGPHEEAFISRFLSKIPGVGQVVNASERHMSAGLNKLRFDMFKDFAKKFPNADEATLKAYAKYLNAATGRGDLGTFNHASADLANAFFSPRLAASRIQTPMTVLSKNPTVRKEAIKDTMKFVATGLGVLKLAEANGAKTSLDPDSPDFGKIVTGNTHVDIWGGEQQPFRVVARLVKGAQARAQGKDSKIDPFKLVEQYLEFKTAPGLSMVRSAYTGKDALGKPITFAQAIGNNLIPLGVQDMMDSADKYGWGKEAALTGTGSFFGLGVSTYKPKASGFTPIP